MNVIEFIIRLKDKASGEAKKATESFQESKRAMDNLRASMKESEAANAELKAAQREVTEATERLTKAVKELNEARESGSEAKAIKAEMDQMKATDDLSASFGRLKSAENKAAQAAQEVASRSEAVRSAQAQVTKSIGTSSREFMKMGRVLQNLARGNISGAVNAFGSISPAVAKAIPVIGTLIVCLAKVRKQVQEFMEAKFEETISDFKDGFAAISEQAKTAANQIKHLREEIKNLHDAQTRENQSNLKIDLSDIDTEEANLRITTANKLANQTDPQKRAEIEEEAAQQKFALQEERINRKYEAQTRQFKIDLEEAEANLAASEKEFADMLNQDTKLRTAINKVNNYGDSAYMNWATAHPGFAKEVVDPLKTGFGLWGQSLESRLKQGKSLGSLRDEMVGKDDELQERIKSKSKSLQDERDRVANMRSKGREEIDARHAADRRALEAARAEHDARQTEKKWKDKEAADAKTREEAERKAADDAEEAQKKADARQKEIDKINDEIRSAEIQKLKNVIRASEAAGKDADAKEKEAKEAEEEARNRNLVGVVDDDKEQRKAEKEAEKRQRRYDNWKERAESAMENLRKFNPKESDAELRKRLPRKWRELLEQEEKKQSDIDAAVAKQNEAQKEKMEAEARRQEAEKKLEERWGYVENIDKILQNLAKKLQDTITVDEAAGENE